MGKIWGKIFSDANWPAFTEIATWFGYLVCKPSLVCIEIMWLKLYRNDFLRVSDQLNRCIESTSALFGNDRKQLQLFYARRGEIAWPNVSHYSLSSKLQSSLDVCRFQMRCGMENCAISRLEIDQKIPYIFQKIFHPAQKRGKKNEWYDTHFFGFNS